jgi:hypothetical protein
MPKDFDFVQETDEYIDYENVLNVGDDSTWVCLRASWDKQEHYGYVGLFATMDMGQKEIAQVDFPHHLTRQEFTALTGHTFTEN